MAYATGSRELRDLADRLKAAGEQGQQLRRRLYRQMNDSVKPLAREIADPAHLRRYLPNRYADTLAADLGVRISKLAGRTPRVEVRASARQHRRKLVRLDAGLINHPIYARGPRASWHWENNQMAGMRAGFFSDAVKQQSPEIRDKVLAAMSETAREITHG